MSRGAAAASPAGTAATVATAAAPGYRPLDGVRVLDLSRLVPGGLATRKLADLGAEVVKVELPDGGDYLRAIPPLFEGEGVMHRVLNRGKPSICVDYRAPEGRALVQRLAGVADVLVESARPGRLAQLGLDPADLRARRPALVVCSITGFGQTGPLAGLPSHGMNMDALAGCMPTEVVDGRPAVAAGVWTSMGSELGALNASLAIVAAVLHARRTGEGAWIDASCWDSAVEAARFTVASLVATGEEFMDLRDMGPMYDVYWSSDRRTVLLCAIEPKFWTSFCLGVGRPDLVERWHGEGAVTFDRDDGLRAELESIFAGATGDEWAERFVEWNVPGCLVLSVADVLGTEHIRSRGLVRRAPDDRFPVVLDPIRWVGVDERPGAGAGPAGPMGADTDDVLARWLS